MINQPKELINQPIEIQLAVANYPQTPPQVLEILVNSSWSWIRQAVARNPHTPPEILAKLAQSTEEKIQLAVARNLASPADVLDLLVNHFIFIIEIRGVCSLNESIVNCALALLQLFGQVYSNCLNSKKKREAIALFV